MIFWWICWGESGLSSLFLHHLGTTSPLTFKVIINRYVLIAILLLVFVFFLFFPSRCVPLWGSKTPHRPAGDRVSWCLETSPPSRLPPWNGSRSLTLLSLSLYLLYFFLPPFKDNGLPFWVPDVLCQHSEVVLWNLLSVQMIFRWICRGERGLPVLFLHRLRTASTSVFLFIPQISNRALLLSVAFLPSHTNNEWSK